MNDCEYFKLNSAEYFTGQKENAEKSMGELEFQATWTKNSNLNNGENKAFGEGGASLGEFPLVLL